MSTNQLIDGWWWYFRLLSGDRAQREALERGEPADAVAAADEVNERITAGGGEALVLVAALVRSARDDDGLPLVAAGPLEDLCTWHGAELAQELQLTARQDPRFARALGVVVWDPDPATRELLAPWLATERRSTPLQRALDLRETPVEWC